MHSCDLKTLGKVWKRELNRIQASMKETMILIHNEIQFIKMLGQCIVVRIFEVPTGE